MLVEVKYFSQDKNYLLKSVQAFSKDALLKRWIKEIFNSYNMLHNPMGLEDDFIIELKSKISNGSELLVDCYDILAAAYRLLYSDNQLEFQWDGRSHMETYDIEWKEKYYEWIKELSVAKEVQRPVIKYATQDSGFNNDFLIASIKRRILGHFKLRLRDHKLYKLSA